MTLFSYEIFDAVARQGSFNKAAQQLHLTPSAISHAIAVMEAELGFTLFNRGKNGVTMTSYGASLYPSIRAVLNSDEALQQSIARLNGLEKGKVKLGAFNSICSGLLPSILKGFMAHYPQIEVEVYQGTYDDVKEWLRTGQVDIAIGLFSFLPHSIRPVSPSTTTAEIAFTFGSSAKTAILKSKIKQKNKAENRFIKPLSRLYFMQ